MPKRSAPEPPLILNEAFNGVATSPYPDRFDFRWNVPPDNGERILAFEISYVPVRNITFYKGATAFSEWEPIASVLNEEKPLGEPRHVLKNLVPGSFYRVEIAARNVIGSGQPATLIIKTAPLPGGKWNKGIDLASSFIQHPVNFGLNSKRNLGAFPFTLALVFLITVLL